MSSPFQIFVQPPPRVPVTGVPPGTQPATQFYIQALAGNFAWGINPGSATITYVGGAPVLFGALVNFQLGALYFAGLCQSCVRNRSSGRGDTWTLEFTDLRTYLTWDWVYGAFNVLDVRNIGGVRTRRYKHLLPVNFKSWTWTYTTAPMTAAQMMAYLLGTDGNPANPTLGSPWRWFADFGALDARILNVDFSDTGRRLDAALAEICQKAGAIVGLISTPSVPYRLAFTVKGLSTLPDWILEDEVKDGFSLSGNPSSIRVLGGRNIYQVMNVPLTKDWADGWEQFLVLDLFADDIYNRAQTKKSLVVNGNNIAAGTRYNAIANDPEQYIGRLLATAHALEITLQEYVDLRNATAGEGEPFRDGRKFAGGLRMNMPCALYIQTLLYRAFRPQLAVLGNVDGNNVPFASLALAEQLLARTFIKDATTGELDFVPAEPADGNGYAVAKGFQIMPELLVNLKSDQTPVEFFKDTCAAWGPQLFQTDDDGEGGAFLIFQHPVIVSSEATGQTLLLEVDGQTVLNANFGLIVPPVKAALCFEAERFSHGSTGARDHCEQLPGLNAEYVAKTDGTFAQIPYADGLTAQQKAQLIINGLLQRQYWYYEGGRKHIWDGVTPIGDFGTPISSTVDRVQPRYGPEEGFYEIVDLTNERRRRELEPERELDRRTLQNTLFPGQQELRQQAETLRQSAATLRQLPKAVTDLFTRFLSGGLNAQAELPVYFNPSGAPLAGTKLPVGSIIRQLPASGKTNTVPVYAPVMVAGKDTRTVFAGVTARQNEDATKPFRVANGGVVLARVLGPVNENDAVGLFDFSTSFDAGTNGNYLTKQTTVPVGQVKAKIATAEVKLVPVLLGAGGAPSPVKMYKLLSQTGDFLVGRSYDPTTDTTGGTDIFIAKLPHLRNSLGGGTILNGDNTTTPISYAYTGAGQMAFQERSGTAGGVIQLEQVIPPYLVNDVIYADAVDFSGVNDPGSNDIKLLERDDQRAWCRLFAL